MIALGPLRAPVAVWDRNAQRSPAGWNGADHCQLCGAPIVDQAKAVMVHVHNGGCDVVTEEEAATLDPCADLGMQPIGPECFRKHKKILEPYRERV